MAPLLRVAGGPSRAWVVLRCGLLVVLPSYLLLLPHRPATAFGVSRPRTAFLGCGDPRGVGCRRRARGRGGVFAALEGGGVDVEMTQQRWWSNLMSIPNSQVSERIAGHLLFNTGELKRPT
jgi:hypothetical protein